MSFPVYAAYKDSGASTLGYVPAGWSVGALKWRLSHNDGGVWGDDPDGIGDTLVLRSTEQTQDGYWRLDDPAFRKLSAHERSSSMLKLDDLLITKSSGSALHIGKTTIVDESIAKLECCYSNFMQRLRLSNDLIAKYMWYILNNDISRTQFGILSNSTTGLANLSAGLIGSIYVPIPTRSEQEAIIAFLDRETAKIDALVEEQRRLITLLKEKRQAVISHAVTKGLNPDASTKDSGVKWLGEVPAHWRVSPLMRLTALGRDIMYGIVLPGPDVGESGVPIVKGGDVKPHRLKLDLLNRTTPEIESPFARARLEPLDIVYSIRGSIGDAEEVPLELEGANITQDVARISPIKNVNSRWLLHMMRSLGVFAQLEQRSLGAAVRGINIYDLKRALVPVPPLAEQDAVAAFLDAECSRLNELSVTASRGIELLQERRAALISAAVTGKIDVRGTAKVLPFAVDRARARGLIATEIIEHSAHQATFGRVKLQKIAYLAEAHVGVTALEGTYRREAAGPLDREMIREMEQKAASLAGIRVEQPHGAGSAVTYQLGDCPGTHRQELTALLGDRIAKFDKLIEDIGTIDTKGAEAVATLYAVWNDALMDGETPDDMEIKLAVLNEWHPEKAKKFRLDEIQIWLDWMRRHGLVPTGTGPKTSTGRLFA